MESIATIGAARQKAPDETTRPVTASSSFRDRPAGAPGLSRTERKIHSEAASATPASSQNTPRQPSCGNIACAGAVVSTLPVEEIAMAMPVIAATRSRGNHCELPLMTDIRPAETPTPSITRAAEKPEKLLESANT